MSSYLRRGVRRPARLGSIVSASSRRTGSVDLMAMIVSRPRRPRCTTWIRPISSRSFIASALRTEFSPASAATVRSFPSNLPLLANELSESSKLVASS
jgi:hypothetical protein